MDFTQLKNLLLGIPESVEEQEKNRAKNMQAMKDELSSMEARRTGREMTEGEKVADAERQAMFDKAADMASGFAGSLKVAGKIPPHLIGTKQAKQVQEIIDQVARGERPVGAAQYALNKAQGGGTLVMEPIGSKAGPKPVKRPPPPTVAEIKEARNPAQQSLQIQPKEKPVVEAAEASVDEVVDELKDRFSAIRKMTGGY